MLQSNTCLQFTALILHLLFDLFRCLFKILKEPPEKFFPPTFLLPIVCTRWEQIYYAKQLVVVSKHIPHTVICICLLCLLDSLDRLCNIFTHRRIEEWRRHRRFPASSGLNVLEDCAG